MDKDNTLGMVKQQNERAWTPDHFIRELLLYQFISLSEKHMSLL